MDAPTGEAPEEEGIDGAKGQLAALGPCPGPRHLVQQPGDLGPGEVGVQQQARALAHQVFGARGAQLLAERCRPAVLPDDRPVDRLAGLAVPDDRGFALVGDADGGDIAHRFAGVFDGAAADRQGVLPDVLDVVLDPAGVWEMLGQFLLGLAEIAALGREENGPGAGRSLIDRKNAAAFGHRAALPLEIRCFLVFLVPAGRAGGRMVSARPAKIKPPWTRHLGSASYYSSKS